MLKKYKESAKMLTALQLKEIKGGMSESKSLMPPQCFVNADCGTPACVGAQEECWVCHNGRCLYRA